MTLNELKQKATASELTLIEAVEEHFKMGTEEQLEWRRKAIAAVLKFMRRRPVPAPGTLCQSDDMKSWIHRLSKEIEAVK